MWGFLTLCDYADAVPSTWKAFPPQFAWQVSSYSSRPSSKVSFARTLREMASPLCATFEPAPGPHGITLSMPFSQRIQGGLSIGCKKSEGPPWGTIGVSSRRGQEGLMAKFVLALVAWGKFAEVGLYFLLDTIRKQD